MTDDHGTPHYQEIVEQKQQRLREKFPEHTWTCKRPDCGGILGLLSFDRTRITVKARGVQCEAKGGEFHRQCGKCGALNVLKSKPEGGRMVFSLNDATVT